MSFSSNAKQSRADAVSLVGDYAGWLLDFDGAAWVAGWGLTQVVSDKAIYIFSVEPVVLGATGYVEAVVRRFGEKAYSGSSQSVSD